MVANSSGTAQDDIIIEQPEETCSGDDALADGVCIGTTVTVTQTGTGTMTSTVTVPVTFTYAPTLQ
ncbi:MAG: hypothetical protein ABJJ44_03855 [Paraglaciecola sp.]|uniref:hypothetical protein n=1 Tax=Paraglaciecola sp. TaxID=1920173 RepID=UPI0032982492